LAIYVDFAKLWGTTKVPYGWADWSWSGALSWVTLLGVIAASVLAGELIAAEEAALFDGNADNGARVRVHHVDGDVGRNSHCESTRTYCNLGTLSLASGLREVLTDTTCPREETLATLLDREATLLDRKATLLEATLLEAKSALVKASLIEAALVEEASIRLVAGGGALWGTLYSGAHRSHQEATT